MPIFEYHCPDCQQDFDELRSSSDRDDPAACPNCKSHRPERKVSLFAGFGNIANTSCSPRGGFS